MICKKCKKTIIKNYQEEKDNSTYGNWPDEWKCKC